MLRFISLLYKCEKILFFNESKFKFNINAVMIKQIYALNFDLWFRGSVISHKLNGIKIMNNDDGLIHCIQIEDIRLLHKTLC